MELKRSFRDDDRSDDCEAPPKRRLAFPDAVVNVMKGISFNEAVKTMEPLFRRVMREEMDRFVSAFQQSISAHNRIEAPGGRGLELRFESNIPDNIFTGTRIQSDHNSAVKVVLFDARSNSIVSSGPMSSAKLEIVVLNSEFPSDDQESWTENDFTRKITRQREGRRPLITGELNVSLRDGVGYVSDVSFTDNSSWTRSGKFKLGARVVQRVSAQVRIREAATRPFVVKDHRGELYMKHHPPQLVDEVWRLKKIAKDGASHIRLAKQGINNLMDFLRMYYTDPSKLRRAIGGGNSNRVWDIIIEHAKECVVNDNKFHVYVRDQAGIFFNSVYKAVGVTFDFQNCLSLDALKPSQKMFAEGLKRHAYKNAHHIVPIDQTSFGEFGKLLENMEAEPFSVSVTDLSLQHLDFPITQQEVQVGFNNKEASTSYGGNEVEVPMTHNYDSIAANLFYPMMRNSFRMMEFSPGNDIGWPQNGCEDIPEFHTPTWSPAFTWGQGNGFINESGVEFLPCLPNVGVHVTRRNSKAGWLKIRAAVKWRISAKQGARRMASFVLNY